MFSSSTDFINYCFLNRYKGRQPTQELWTQERLEGLRDSHQVVWKIGLVWFDFARFGDPV